MAGVVAVAVVVVVVVVVVAAGVVVVVVAGVEAVAVAVAVVVVVVVVAAGVKRHERFKHEGPRLHMAMLSAAVHLKAWIREEIESILCEHPDELLIWADVYVGTVARH